MQNSSGLHNPPSTRLTGRPPAALVLLAFLVWSGVAAAQEAADDKPGKLFSAETSLAVTMTAPWGDVMKKWLNCQFPDGLFGF